MIGLKLSTIACLNATFRRSGRHHGGEDAGVESEQEVSRQWGDKPQDLGGERRHCDVVRELPLKHQVHGNAVEEGERFRVAFLVKGLQTRVMDQDKSRWSGEDQQVNYYPALVRDYVNVDPYLERVIRQIIKQSYNLDEHS